MEDISQHDRQVVVMTYSHDIPISDLFDELILSLDELIDRRFALERTLIVERESEKHWVARIGDVVLYRSPDMQAVQRFAETFAQRTPGVTVQYPSSVRVAVERTLSDGSPVYPGGRGYEHAAQHVDNVVALPARAEA